MDQFYGSNDLMAIPSAMWQFDKWPNMTVYATYFATATLGGESYRYKAVFGHKIINVLTYSGTTTATATTTTTTTTTAYYYYMTRSTIRVRLTFHGKFMENQQI